MSLNGLVSSSSSSGNVMILVNYVRSCSRDVLGGRDVLELELKLKLET